MRVDYLSCEERGSYCKLQHFECKISKLLQDIIAIADTSAFCLTFADYKCKTTLSTDSNTVVSSGYRKKENLL